MKMFLKLELADHKYYLVADINNSYDVWAAGMILAKDSMLKLTTGHCLTILEFSQEFFDAISSRLDFQYLHETAVNKIRSWMEEITTCNQKKSKPS